MFYIFLGLLFGKFLNLMSAKAAAHLYRNETRQIFTVFDVQGFFS